MRITKVLISMLLIAALLAACTAVPTQTGTTTQSQQPSTTTQPKPTETEPKPTETEPKPTETQPVVTQPATTQPPATEPAPAFAPDFTVYDAEGNEVKLSDFIGKPIILNFWASWCFPCITEMPHFNTKYQEYGDQIQFLMVNVTAADTMEEAQALLEQRGFEFPVLFDMDGDAMTVYKVSSIPVTYLINSEGIIIEEVVGSMNKKELQKLIDKLLAEG